LAAGGRHHVVTSLPVPTARRLGGTQSDGGEKNLPITIIVKIIIFIQSVASYYRPRYWPFTAQSWSEAS